MLTRFAPQGYFPLHGHPGGEEILVLEGDFADETGIHPPGTYMLNPEDFVHRPYSEAGYLTFVKLRQHRGKHRQPVRTKIFARNWQPSHILQVQVLPVYEQARFSEKVWFERWQVGTQLPKVSESEVREIFVVEGNISDEFGQYSAYSWLRYPPYQPYSLASETGCLIYVKTYPVVDSALRFIVDKEFQHPEETVRWDQTLDRGH